MAQKGWWGDKMIVSLSGKDQRRQKQWCDFYRKDDKFCTKQVLKCQGSSQCPYYKKKAGRGPVDERIIPKDIPVKVFEEPKSNTTNVTTHIYSYIPGHNPPFGEKLLGAIVLIKGIAGHITVGEVIFENHDIVQVEKDDGTIVKYSRRYAVSNKTFWVLDDIEDN